MKKLFLTDKFTMNMLPEYMFGKNTDDEAYRIGFQENITIKTIHPSEVLNRINELEKTLDTKIKSSIDNKKLSSLLFSMFEKHIEYDRNLSTFLTLTPAVTIIVAYYTGDKTYPIWDEKSIVWFEITTE